MRAKCSWKETTIRVNAVLHQATTTFRISIDILEVSLKCPRLHIVLSSKTGDITTRLLFSRSEEAFELGIEFLCS